MTQRPFITCRQLIDFIADYLAGELDELSHSDFERHIDRCRSCQAYLDSYRKTMSLAHSLSDESPAEDVPEELVLAILRRNG
jgi:anti-sigma factor RsiW